jgi:hypothetical protein
MTHVKALSLANRAANRAANRTLCGLVLAAMFGLAGWPASAQSLGDLAKQEEARRRAIATSGKVYTNDSLRAAPTTGPESTGEASAPASATAGSPASGASSSAAAADAKKDEAKPEAKADTPKKDEAYWRQRLQAERDGIERSKVLIDALQSRVSALQTDFVNRDDPASRGQLASERQRALAELDKMKKEIDQRTKAVADIQEEARKAGAPAAWYR